jgi:hypothetical protein
MEIDFYHQLHFLALPLLLAVLVVLAAEHRKAIAGCLVRLWRRLTLRGGRANIELSVDDIKKLAQGLCRHHQPEPTEEEKKRQRDQFERWFATLRELYPALPDFGVNAETDLATMRAKYEEACDKIPQLRRLRCGIIALFVGVEAVGPILHLNLRGATSRENLEACEVPLLRLAAKWYPELGQRQEMGPEWQILSHALGLIGERWVASEMQ